MEQQKNKFPKVQILSRLKKSGVKSQSIAYQISIFWITNILTNILLTIFRRRNCAKKLEKWRDWYRYVRFMKFKVGWNSARRCCCCYLCFVETMSTLSTLKEWTGEEGWSLQIKKAWMKWRVKIEESVDYIFLFIISQPLERRSSHVVDYNAS